MILTFLGIIAGIVMQYARVDRATEFGEGFRITMPTVLDDILSEAKSAYLLAEPSVGTTTAILLFERLDASTDGARFPEIPLPPNPSPLTWDPFPAGSRVVIRYFKSGRDLVREATHSGGLTNRNIVFDQCDGFAVRRVSQSVLEVTLSTEKDARVESRAGRAWCPCL